MGSLADRVALVTGGGRGIGRGIACRLGADGALVAVHYGQREDTARETVDLITAAGGRAFPVRAVLGEPGDAVALFKELDVRLEELGEPAVLDVLVNNAGFNIPGRIAEVRPEDFDRLMAVHAKAPVFLVQQAIERMRDGGRIVNIGSAATRVAFPESLAYAMAKGALEALTLALARELGPRQITVNSVSPGFVKTDMNRRRWSDPEGEAAHAAHSVLGRMGRPEDVADIVAFLASDDARWVTGQSIDASGGSFL
ncbi:SDR family oxidoreductase [Streptomyces asoensis]|uniref:SDR family oxidoreductase n=1 Tax=Streptomyces asoensis TaxID=249586 RepID=UPI0037B69370